MDQPSSIAGRVYAAASSLDWIDALKRRPMVHQLRRALRQSRLVDRRAAYAFNEFLRRGGVHDYRLRRDRIAVSVRHGVTTWVFEEVFRHRGYEPPASLRSVDPRTVLDLGGNVGYFGAFALSRFPEAEITAYEPDPVNAALHRRAIELNRAAGRWRLVEACASDRGGEVAFIAEGTGRSRIALDASQPTLRVPASDVLPLIARSDFVKMDIEGGEWAILADPRLGDAGPTVIVLEYHPAPGTDEPPRKLAAELLERAGFSLVDAEYPAGRFPERQGMIWAVRQG